MPGLAGGHLAPRGQVVDADLRRAAARQQARALRVQRHAQQLTALRQRGHRVARRVVPELRARAPARVTQHAQSRRVANEYTPRKLQVNLDAGAT